MSKRARQIYFTIVCSIAIIALAGILIFVSGYRFDFFHLRFNQTGSLSISTLPKRAQVTIQETHKTADTPVIINQLLPGEYTITVSKPECASWEGKVTIEPNKTILLPNILLFNKTTTAEFIEDYPVNGLIKKQTITKIKNLSPEMQYALSELNVAKDSDVIAENVPWTTVLNTQSDDLYLLRNVSNRIEVNHLAKKIIGFEWDIDSQQLMYYSANEIMVYDHKAHSSRIITRQSEPIQEVVWHPRGGYIFFISGRTIYAIETRLTDAPNTSLMYTGKKTAAMRFNQKGDTIYFQDSGGIYSLRLF